MDIRYPNYYKKFQCIAGSCPDTCCAGWEISVDPKSEKQYRDAQKEMKRKNPGFAAKLRNHIKNGRIISEDVTCPFLNQDKLCEMYIELGPDSLCSTCRRHPRHMEDYGNLHEMLLLLSCPEAARLILEENDGSFYVRTIPERHGNMDGIDENFLKCLLGARTLIWNVCADEQVELRHCMAFALALAHDMQGRIHKNKNGNGGVYAAVSGLMERYSEDCAAERFKDQWKKRTAVSEDTVDAYRYDLMQDLMKELDQLDVICRDWPAMLKRCMDQIESARETVKETVKETGGEYPEARKQYFSLGSKADTDLKKIFQYFIYSFMLSALYDEDVLTKVKMAVCCTMMIAEMDFQQFVAGESVDRQKHCYALARQIENSDDNRGTLEQCLKSETFRTRRMLHALI